jgi:hypothetical protein
LSEKSGALVGGAFRSGSFCSLFAPRARACFSLQAAQKLHGSPLRKTLADHVFGDARRSGEVETITFDKIASI